MFDSLKAWLLVHHVDVMLSGALAFFFPSLLQLMIKPPPGSKAEAALGALSSWGFDAEKFFRKLGELLASTRTRGIAHMDAIVLVVILLLSGCAWLRSSPAVREAELVLHAADSACGVVALLHADDTASAVCLVVKELDALDAHLAKAETAEADAPLVVVAKDTSSRTVRVRREYVKRARAAVKVARGDVTP